MEAVFRNRRRSLYALAGIVIALSLVSGSTIAVDSSALGRLKAALRTVPVDITGQSFFETGYSSANESECEEAVEAFEAVRDVEDASAAVVLDAWTPTNSDGKASYLWSSTTAFLLLDDGDRLLEAYGIDGALPDAGTVGISSLTAADLGVGVGDDLTLNSTHYMGSEFVNGTWVERVVYMEVTMPISQIFIQDYDIYHAQHPYTDYEGSEGSISIMGRLNPAVLRMSELGSFVDSAEEEDISLYGQTYYPIWIDRSEVIDLADLQGTAERLAFIEGRLSYAGQPYDVYYFYSPLMSALMSVNDDLTGMKVLFFGLSLPVVGLGAYLSIVGVDLGLSERRREIGILKSRGASNRQVLSSFIVESVVLGCIAGVAGLGLGIITSRFLLSSTGSLLSTSASSETELTDLVIGPSTVVYSMVAGVLLMALAAYRPFKRASKTETAEALHYYVSKETKVDYRPKWDIAALFLVALSIYSVVYGLDGFDFYSGSFLVSIIVVVLFIVGLGALPALPFLLSLSTIRLLTRGPRRLYSHFTRLMKPWTKELHYIVDKNIVRNPKRASNMCVIIALAVAFGLFISVTMETMISYQERVIEAEIGADVRIFGEATWNGTDHSVDIGVMDSISSVDGVARHTRFAIAEVSGHGYYYFTAAVIDSSAYLDIVDPEGFWFVDCRPGILDDLGEAGTVLVSEWYARDYFVVVGDVLSMTVSGTAELQATVIGVVKGLPGIDAPMYLDYATVSDVPEDRLGTQLGVFVDVAKGYDDVTVAEEVEDVCALAGLNIYSTKVKKVELVELSKDPAYGALSDFLYMEYVLSFAIMSVGVGLIIFVTVSERERELACIMARGCSRGQVRRILMGESLSLMTMGMVVGVAVGLLTAWLFGYLLSVNTYAEVPYEMMFTYVSWGIVVASIGAFLLASLLASGRAGRMRLAEVLRIRGG